MIVMLAFVFFRLATVWLNHVGSYPYPGTFFIEICAIIGSFQYWEGFTVTPKAKS
jgi:hypothetical protein